MGINRVDISENGKVRTLIDISDSTITQDAAVEGAVCYGPDGEKIIGSNPYKKTETDNEVQTQEDLIEEILQELEGKASNSGGIDTSDATVVEDTLEEGVIAYGSNGKVIGTLEALNGFSGTNIVPTKSGTNVRLQGTVSEKAIYKKGATLRLDTPISNFGTATASDVAQGVTFTSESGLKVEGELVVHDTVGTVGIASNYDKYKAGDDLCVDVFTDIDVLIRSGSGLGATIPLSEFGTATEDKVLEGVTYTGADGHKKQGKMKASSGVTLPDGAIVVQKVIGAEASTQVGSGYSLSITYGDSVEINDSLALAFVGSTKSLSNISASSDFSVLQGKYIRSGSSYSTTGTFYYIPDGSTFTVGGQSMSKTLTCDRAQQVTIQKVTL